MKILYKDSYIPLFSYISDEGDLHNNSHNIHPHSVSYLSTLTATLHTTVSTYLCLWLDVSSH